MEGRRTRLTRAEIIRTLRRWRHDPEHRGGRKGFTVYNIAALANCDVEDVQKVVRYGHFDYPALEARLSRAVEALVSGEVRIVFNLAEKGHDGWVRGRPKWRFEHVARPVRRPPPQEKITRAVDHREWARCRTCQGEKWEALVIHGAPFYVCTACLGPPHWRGMGARKADAVERLEMFGAELREDFSQL